MHKTFSESHTSESTISIKEWLIMLLIFAIPLVNIVMLFVWAFSQQTPPSKANFCKAYILFVVLMSVLLVVLALTLGVSAQILQAIQM